MEYPENFRKILQLVLRHDLSLSNRFPDSGVVTRYTSKDIQNEIWATLSDMVREQIIEEVKESEYFSVLVDETKDISKREQVSFVLRYFANRQSSRTLHGFQASRGVQCKILVKSNVRHSEVLRT